VQEVLTSAGQCSTSCAVVELVRDCDPSFCPLYWEGGEGLTKAAMNILYCLLKRRINFLSDVVGSGKSRGASTGESSAGKLLHSEISR
jgi:hypothetical protein